VSGQLHAPASFNPGKKPPVPIVWEVGEPQTWSGRDEEVIILDATGLELQSLGRTAHSQSLYRLRYPDLYCSDEWKSKSEGLGHAHMTQVMIKTSTGWD
jgi:hypothetical protein